MTKGIRINFVLTVISVIFLKNVPTVESTIRCYKCLAALPQYYSTEPVRLCKDFDYSEKFIVTCPYSTFCTKKITSAKIPTTINGTERDCANQKHVIQNYHHGEWHQEVSVEEPYTPGCHKLDDKGTRTSNIEYCYCNTELCNSGNSYKTLGYLKSFIFVILFLYKYF
ncbi:uncharacterized protein LOC130902561 [Diorhabda carinulata]|uniref:uncharacterized protein LOC130447295 n=1 Tax=Diorhabda sublineata TaxID=1163346 RepID=UPI0024E079E3|nr:uncharacterized protein LOC130447295 [Diorhabda sublineata]XP_057670769.1 uncharacterized protein LOC130902561 [Diorhabda carinulata]